METIKFRGLRIDGKGWVYGLLNQYQSKLYITNETIEHPTHSDPAGSWIYNENEVIPESVGQFTGLTDKNGKEIYSGDITDEGTVIFHKNYLGFFVKSDKNEYSPLYDVLPLEIIGNIFENKDLINQNK